jgi:hypothetical protein
LFFYLIFTQYKTKKMFNSKKTQLFERQTKASGETAVAELPTFVKAGQKKSAETLSGNGALKYSTTGNEFVDQFGQLGSFKAPRPFAEIAADCEKLWAINPLLFVIFTLYIRTIVRVVSLWNGHKTAVSQRGAELRHEGIMRMIWLSQKAPDTFWKNLPLFVSVGSWKDIFTMLQYDLVYNGWGGRVLDWDKFGNFLLSSLENKNTSELVKKYLPQIKSRSKCTTVESQADTLVGKWLCSKLFGEKEGKEGTTYKHYRRLKSAGTAHEWQQLISRKQFERIDFDKIHGRALNLLVRSKFLKNQGLSEKYTEWVKKPETEVKYTGFVHELFSKLPEALVKLPVHEQETINKQFGTLVQKGKTEEHTTSLIVVRDTSGSMGSTATGTNMTCYNIAKALALYFSEFLQGKFKDAWIEFNSDAKMHTWKGTTPLEKWYNDHSSFVGSTDFQSVVRLLCRIKAEGVPESEFPSGILCISDGEFNPAQLGQTNVEVVLQTLRAAGFSEEYVSNFVIVLWNLQSGYYGKGTGKKFETFGTDVPNVFYFSGYSAATVGFLTSKIKNAQELFDAAMDQEVLKMVEL